MTKQAKPTGLTTLAGLAKRAGRWLGLAADTTPPRHESAIVSDRFDTMTWTEIEDQAAAVRDLTEDLSERYDYAGDLVRDVFMGAYKVQPEVRPGEQMHPGRMVNHRVISTMLDSPEFGELRRETVGDQYAAAMAVLAQGDTLRGLLEQTREAQDAAQTAADAQRDAEQAAQAVADAIQQAVEQASQAPTGNVGQDGAEGDGHSAESTVPDGAAQMVNDAIAAAEHADQAAQTAMAAAEQATTAATAGIRAGIRRAAAEAADQAQEEAALMRTWGVEPGQLQRMSFEQRAQLAQRLRSGRLGRFVDLIGRFRTMATGERARKVEHAPGELVGITLGDDLGRLIPSELANLGVAELRAVFAAKYAEQRLMLYDSQGEDTTGQGAIIACVDCSFSMGRRHAGATGEAWAKACALALLDQARTARRDFVGILFSSEGEHDVYRFPAGQPINITTVLDFAETFYAGGTDFETPLTAAVDVLQAEYNTTGKQRGDIVLITDGECGVTENWMRSWIDQKRALDFRTFGIAIGTTPGPVLEALSDNVRSIDDLTDTHAAADLFRVI